MRQICLVFSGLAVSGSFTACYSRSSVQCETDPNCNLTPGGICTAAPTGRHWCSYPDPACPSGYRFSDLDVGDGVADQCVAVTDGGVDAPSDEMIQIPGGSFIRGCETEPGCTAEWGPRKQVTVSTFMLDRNEVTQIQYKACMDVGQCTPPLEGWDPGAKPNHPIQGVSWYQAAAYCAWKGKRLPTEAEWEKGARGTDGRWYPWGNFKATCDRHLASYLECNGELSLPVGTQLGDSPFGLKDMNGNISEWVQDWFSDTYYQTAPDVDPPGPDSGTFGSYKIVRGGGVGYREIYMGTYKRHFNLAESPAQYIGFRCAL
jgi:formylglycine-generating enzyme